MIGGRSAACNAGIVLALIWTGLTQATRLVWADSEGRDVARDMRSSWVTGLHPTKHGSLYISANTPHFWKALCELTGLPEVASDPHIGTGRKRAEHADDLVHRIRTALRAHTAFEWEVLLGERVPCAAARAVEDMFEHPQVVSEGILASFEYARVGRYRGMAHPIRFGAGSTPVDLLMRSKLLVPASRPEFFVKALASDADAISFDLEDAVRETRKAEARRAVQTFLQETPPRPCRKAIVVRVNGHRTPHFEADVAAVAWPGVDMINLGDVFEPFGIGRTDALAVHGMQRGVLLMARS